MAFVERRIVSGEVLQGTVIPGGGGWVCVSGGGGGGARPNTTSSPPVSLFGLAVRR